MTNSLLRLLISGGHGQLGHALRQHSLASKFHIKACSRADMDITQQASIQQAILLFRPHLVMNAAAYTAVDKAEQHTELAMQSNYLGANFLAMACQQHNIPLIHLSTDYVFDGNKTTPYREDEPAYPLNIYGKSKYLGEQAISEHCEQHLILRVSGLFSEYGHNFLKTILRLADEKESLHVVADQITCPTDANDIAGTLYVLAEKMIHQPNWRSGKYHYCSANALSWHQFALAIIHEAQQQKSLLLKKIHAISAADYQTAAKRPAYTALDCSKIKTDFGILQPSWDSTLKNVIARLLATSHCTQ